MENVPDFVPNPAQNPLRCLELATLRLTVARHAFTLSAMACRVSDLSA